LQFCEVEGLFVSHVVILSIDRRWTDREKDRRHQSGLHPTWGAMKWSTCRAMFVVRDAPQRARRQPSRNLAQALQTARLRASALADQQVNGKGHHAVINRTAV
jgi:hypothetical protein